jgi:hypothetical protein
MLTAQIIGNDLSAIQSTWYVKPEPKYGNVNRRRVPPNVKFEIDDVEQPWINGEFDYIFSRYMSTSILDWPKLVGNVFE